MLGNAYFWIGFSFFSAVAPGEASSWPALGLAPSFLSNAYFWTGFSFFSAFALTYWFLQKPATFLILLAMAFASFFLLGPLGLVGFAAGAGARMFLKEKQAESKKQEAARKKKGKEKKSGNKTR
ncbi:hypothetical protein HZC09_02115 [Candidatus Micrarchaeota archaeon]|nr:hypothetical protein [Candidatus Micrarchaeota archaeon]